MAVQRSTCHDDEPVRERRKNLTHEQRAELSCLHDATRLCFHDATRLLLDTNGQCQKLQLNYEINKEWGKGNVTLFGSGGLGPNNVRHISNVHTIYLSIVDQL